MEVDPSYPLPAGFKKVKHSEFEHQYKIPSYSGVPESVMIVTSILDDIVSERFGVHFLEPTSVSVDKFTAKPLIKELSTRPMANQDITFSLKKHQPRTTHIRSKKALNSDRSIKKMSIMQSTSPKRAKRVYHEKKPKINTSL